MWAKWNWNYLFFRFIFFSFAFLMMFVVVVLVVWLLFSITIIYLIRVFHTTVVVVVQLKYMWKLRQNKIWNAIILPPPVEMMKMIICRVVVVVRVLSKCYWTQRRWNKRNLFGINFIMKRITRFILSGILNKTDRSDSIYKF